MRYDPMTGEPIQEEGFAGYGQDNPQAGGPYNSQAMDQGRRYDPMTGEPVNTDYAETEIDRTMAVNPAAQGSAFGGGESEMDMTMAVRSGVQAGGFAAGNDDEMDMTIAMIPGAQGNGFGSGFGGEMDMTVAMTPGIQAGGFGQGAGYYGGPAMAANPSNMYGGMNMPGQGNMPGPGGPMPAGMNMPDPGSPLPAGMNMSGPGAPMPAGMNMPGPGAPVPGDMFGQGPMRGFDPMTGKPLGGPGTPMPPSYADGQAAPMEPAKKKRRLPVIVASVIVLLLVLGGVIGGLIASGVLLKPADKILLATLKTYTEHTPAVVDSLQPEKVIKWTGDKTFHSSVTVDLDGISVLSDVDVSPDNLQLAGTFSYMVLRNQEYVLSLKEDGLRAHVPLLSDSSLKYDYNAPLNDYLMDTIGSYNEESIEQINKGLKQISSALKKEDGGKDLSASLLKKFRALDFKTAEKASFEIDGKEVDCKGYEYTITSSMTEKAWDGLFEILGESKNSISALEEIDEVIRDLIDEIGDINIKVYLHKGKLAALLIGFEDKEDVNISLLFKGGDYRYQTTEIKVEDKYTKGRIVFQSQNEGETETYKIYTKSDDVKMDVLDLSFDTKTGEYECVIGDDGLSYTAKGVIESTDDQVSWSLDSLKGASGDKEDIKLKLSISDTTDFKELPQDEILVNDLTEEDINKMGEEIFSRIMGLPGF